MMPLLDHFHPPLSDRRRWEGFHGLWAAALVEKLNREILGEEYFADMQVHIGSQVEVDVATLEEPRAHAAPRGGAPASATLAVPAWAPPAAALVMPSVFPDEIEVQIFATAAGATLVAAVELVSPSNKDRPETCRAFAAKCVAYLTRGIGLIVLDIVTNRLPGRGPSLAHGAACGPLSDRPFRNAVTRWRWKACTFRYCAKGDAIMCGKFGLGSALALAILQFSAQGRLTPACANSAGADAAAISPDGTRVYVAVSVANPPGDFSSAVSVIDAATLRVVATTEPREPGRLGSMAVSTDGSRLYTAGWFGGNVYAIDAAASRVVASVEAGDSNAGLVLSPDARYFYVAASDFKHPKQDHPLLPAGHLAVIDTTNDQVVAMVPLESETGGVVLSPDGKRVYVINADYLDPKNPNGSLAVIEAASRRVAASVKLAGYPSQPVLSPDGQRIYLIVHAVASLEPYVTVIDTAALQVVANLKLARHPDKVVVSPDGKRIYVIVGSVSPSNARIVVIDAATLEVAASLKVTHGQDYTPEDLEVSPDGRRVYLSISGSVSGGDSSDLFSVLDTDTLQVIGSVDLGLGRQVAGSGETSGRLLTLSPDGKRAYLVDHSTVDVVVVDTDTLQVAATVRLGTAPTGGD